MTINSILIVGGGTAGWLTAVSLARTLSNNNEGVRITIVDSPAIGSIGVGEGTFPTIRRTLQRVGISELDLIRQCGATFKQGIRFVDWLNPPQTAARRPYYLHLFQPVRHRSGLDLLPYWLLGVGGDVGWDEAGTPQAAVVDACRGPKTIQYPEFEAPLDYAYHIDAARLANLLQKTAIKLGVQHVEDTVDNVVVDRNGLIASVHTKNNQKLSADLYVDCTGFSAQLIDRALGSKLRSCKDVLFCDSAVTIQVPRQKNQPVESCTISTAQDAGWIWDIGLMERRGTGYVYSSSHTDDSYAEDVLRNYLGAASTDREARLIRFNAGYREQGWIRNCVAIGLSAGFFEPLESTGIILIEAAAALVAQLFPWNGDFEAAARQFNRIMQQRFERALDFIKLHFCLSQRRDSNFWHDNVSNKSIPASLQERLERWRCRPPSNLDVDLNYDLFTEHSWQQVLYGMGYRTDLGPRAATLRHFSDAAIAFAEIQRQAHFACQNLPSHHELLRALRSEAAVPRVGMFA